MRCEIVFHICYFPQGVRLFFVFIFLPQGFTHLLFFTINETVLRICYFHRMEASFLFVYYSHISPFAIFCNGQSPIPTNNERDIFQTREYSCMSLWYDELCICYDFVHLSQPVDTSFWVDFTFTFLFLLEIKFTYTNWVIRSCKSMKDKQYNG